MAQIETVRVVSTDAASQGPFVVMDKKDFDPQVHKLYQEPKSTKGKAAPGDVTKEPDNGNG